MRSRKWHYNSPYIQSSNPPTVDSPYFSNFQSDINMLAVDVYPKLFARKGHRARVRLAGAFARYFSRFRLGHSSAFIEGHYETAAKFGMTPQHMGQIEVGTLIGILVNTIPTLFYMLHSICADETLLRDVRAEVEACITIGSEIDLRSTGKRLSMDSTKIREACPLLVSVFQEVLRFYSRGATARLVLEDTMLNEQYLLKKDAVIIMPTSVIHSNSSVWGSAEFNPRRFVKTKDGPRRNAPAAAYRPFGGGYAMCPGRHFAAVEILALTAMLVHQYDIKPVSGEWKLPTAVQPSLAVNVFPPKEDVRVWMVPREGLEDVEWVFGVV